MFCDTFHDNLTQNLTREQTTSHYFSEHIAKYFLQFFPFFREICYIQKFSNEHIISSFFKSTLCVKNYISRSDGYV